MRFLLLIIGINLLGTGYTQEETSNSNKNKVFIYWGWNRGYYSKSDIHFTGQNYDFTLEKVIAKDRQTKFALDPYFNPVRITIPQTNFKAGFFFHEKYNISFGVDHMKYVMQQDQTVRISGYIDASDTIYNKSYQEESIVLTHDFLKFEHTDGLNYVNVELNRFDNVLTLFSDKFPIGINLTEGIGIGALYPKTNAKLMNFEQNDEFHVAGYGISSKVGIDISFLKHFFFRFEGKAGYINMPDIRTTPNKEDKASQHFFFLQRNFLIGGSFNIGNKN